MMSDDEAHRNAVVLQEDAPFPYWRVWKTVKALETEGLTSTKKADVRYQETLTCVTAILRQWGHKWAGQNEWQSLLNKKSLQHEAEESIVALTHLHEWLKTREETEEPVIVVDVCCGKGLFSMLLSYMVGQYWKSDISQIVMLDRATSICWNHIHVANGTAKEEGRPTIQVWEGCNLHDYDAVLDRLQSLESPLALVGIHLCKTLGPSCLGLANGLGPKQCPYVCLAPCCLPRIAIAKATKSPRCIPVNLYETQQERQTRLNATKQRKLAVQGQCLCYVCGEQHRVRDCPQLPSDEDERTATIQKTAPCWKCGLVGHRRMACPSTVNRPPRLEPPFVTMNVEAVLQSPQPFDTYCRLLADTLQDCSSKELMEPGLISTSSTHQEGNWNSERKSIYIVATR